MDFPDGFFAPVTGRILQSLAQDQWHRVIPARQAGVSDRLTRSVGRMLYREPSWARLRDFVGQTKDRIQEVLDASRDR